MFRLAEVQKIVQAVKSARELVREDPARAEKVLIEVEKQLNEAQEAAAIAHCCKMLELATIEMLEFRIVKGDARKRVIKDALDHIDSARFILEQFE